jgi:hypothetical protein
MARAGMPSFFRPAQQPWDMTTGDIVVTATRFEQTSADIDRDGDP